MTAPAPQKIKRRYLSPSFRRKIYERDGKICYICKEPTRFFFSNYDSPYDDRPKAGSVDHIIPVSKGGSDDESNLRWCCKSCNCSKGNRG